MNFHNQNRSCHPERSEGSPGRGLRSFAEFTLERSEGLRMTHLPILLVKLHYRGGSCASDAGSLHYGSGIFFNPPSPPCSQWKHQTSEALLHLLRGSIGVVILSCWSAPDTGDIDPRESCFEEKTIPAVSRQVAIQTSASGWRHRSVLRVAPNWSQPGNKMVKQSLTRHQRGWTFMCSLLVGSGSLKEYYREELNREPLGHESWEY
jgi:hypothetical protein